MEINGLPSINGISSNPVADGELSEETFLLLLTTQLQNQDPLEPAKDVEFIEQMATFASLEQQRLTNQNFDVLHLYQSSINNSNALGIVGKDVKLQDNQMDHQVGESHTIFYESDSQAASVEIKVYDEDGREVFSQTQVGAEDGEQTFTWHGKDTEGNDLAEGEYTISINLLDDEGTKFPTNVYQAKRVKGVSYEGGSIFLMVDDKQIPIENVIEVYEPGSLTGESGSGSSGPDFKSKSFQPLTVIPGGGYAIPHPSLTANQYQPFQVIAGGR